MRDRLLAPVGRGPTFGPPLDLFMTQTDLAQLDRRRSQESPIYGPEAFEGMRSAGRLTAEALDLLVPHVRPGVTTEFLDQLVFEFAMDHGAYPAPLFYR